MFSAPAFVLPSNPVASAIPTLPQSGGNLSRMKTVFVKSIQASERAELTTGSRGQGTFK